MKSNFLNIFSGGIFPIAVILCLSSCVREANSPGYEYMPDMYRSPAIEAYVDYGEVRDTLHQDMQYAMSARKPPVGTVPMSGNIINDMPYTIPNTPEGYELAGEILKTPLKETEEIVAEGQEIYINFCIHCHGETGAGDGPVVTIGGHPPPGAYDGPLKDLSEGKMFHTITYGKGAMGPHKSLLHKVDRWKVIAYVKTLQGVAAPTETDSTSADVQTPQNNNAADMPK